MRNLIITVVTYLLSVFLTFFGLKFLFGSSSSGSSSTSLFASKSEDEEDSEEQDVDFEDDDENGEIENDGDDELDDDEADDEDEDRDEEDGGGDDDDDFDNDNYLEDDDDLYDDDDDDSEEVVENDDDDDEGEGGGDEQGDDDPDEGKGGASADDVSGDEKSAEDDNDSSSSDGASKEVVSLSTVIENYRVWSVYDSENIELAYDFKPLDTDDKEITKEEFLKKQTSGDYIPLKIDDFIYKLHKLPENVEDKIRRAAKSKANIALYYYNLEGADFPDFDVKDLNGASHSLSKSKGKFIVVKCWFVRCAICVREFPELNELFDKYEGNENIEFISFAFDKEDALKKFLAKKEFRYPVIAGQQKFISKEIKARQYPLHILVSKEGKILKMVNSAVAIKHFIRKNLKK